MIDDPNRTPGHYGAGYGDPARHLGTAGPPWHPDDEHHEHWPRLRDEHARRLDEEYALWRREHFADEFERWRAARQEVIAPEHEGALRSWGRAVSEVVTGSRDPVLG
jgi:hypothetical protein